MTAVYRYRFARSTPLDEVEQTLTICSIAIRSLHGIDAGHHLDRRRGTCVVDGRTDAGRDMAKLIDGFLTREFGPESFAVEEGETGRHADEYRTLGEWVAELDLDAEVVAHLLAADPGISLATPLTVARLDDLIGLAARTPEESR